MADKKDNQPHSGGEGGTRTALPGGGATRAPKIDDTDLVDANQLPSEDDDITEARRDIPGNTIEIRDEESDSSEASTAHTAGAHTGGEHDVEDPFAMQMEAAKPGQATIASLRERLAAFLVDCGVLWLLYWGCLFLFNKIVQKNWLGPVPTFGYNALLFHGIFLALAFLYFFLLEAAFFATIGKFCCWMYVRRKDGRHAGVLGIFIRNFFRIIEWVTGGLLTWIPMELSHRHQRLGDMAAGTIVIKKHSTTTRYYPLDADKLASAFGRSLAGVIDLALILIWLVGYVMLLNDKALYLSQWLVIAFPVFFILFWTLVQLIIEGSPGLWLIGYTVTHEDGGRLTFAGALLRTLLAPLDLLLGIPCMLLSLRKQQIGDMLAATVVSRQRRRWKGAVGSLIVVAISVGLVALGLFINPLNNVFKAGPDFRLEFMPRIEGLPAWESTAMQPPVLTVNNFRFGVNDPNTRRTPPVYEGGETVYLLFEISGYLRKDRLVWIQEDLMVQYPDGSIGLKQENVVDYHQLIKPGGAPIELTNDIALPPTAPPGTYVVTVTLRDLLANNYTVTETQSFTVKAPPVTTSPLEAAPTVGVPTAGAPTAGVAPPPMPVEPYGTPTPTTPPPPPSPATIPSSPLPVLPAAPAPLPSPPVGEGQGEGVIKTMPTAPAPATPGAVAPTAPTPSTPPAALPQSPPAAGGFTVIPGPTIAPKEEAAPPPTIPVPQLPKAVTPPADQYGKAAPSVPGTVTPAAPAAATPVVPSAPSPIIEKTLAPSVPPKDPYGAAVKPPVDSTAKPPQDAYAKPVIKPKAETKPVPIKVEKPKAAEKPAAKPTTPPKAVEKSVEKPKAVTPTEKPKATPPTSETQKAAEKELEKLSPPKAVTPAPKSEPAKPAAEIPSAEAVKKQTEQAAPAPAKKKKKASSGGGSSGGYMP